MTPPEDVDAFLADLFDRDDYDEHREPFLEDWAGLDSLRAWLDDEYVKLTDGNPGVMAAGDRMAAGFREGYMGVGFDPTDETMLFAQGVTLAVLFNAAITDFEAQGEAARIVKAVVLRLGFAWREMVNRLGVPQGAAE